FQEATENVKENPKNYLYHYNLARLYNAEYLLLGAKDSELERRLVHAQTFAPQRLELPLALVQLALLKNDFDGVVAQSKAGIARNKKFTDFYRIAFLGYSAKGDEENAFSMLDEGITNGLVLRSAKEVNWLAGQYEKRSMPEKARALRERFPTPLL
ncbi:hypothetical protein HYR65_04110, partial [Candidatus Azambacteria bacterium]|nr:hypothetical protein [Candidatus Azambacteria bacterium]